MHPDLPNFNSEEPDQPTASRKVQIRRIRRLEDEEQGVFEIVEVPSVAAQTGKSGSLNLIDKVLSSQVTRKVERSGSRQLYGISGVAIKKISRSDPLMRSRQFVFPSTLMLEALAQLAEFCLGEALDVCQGWRLVSVDHLEVHQEVVEPVELQLQIIVEEYREGSSAVVEGSAHLGGNPALSVQFVIEPKYPLET